MKKWFKLAIFALFVAPVMAMAATTPEQTFQAGKDYEVLTTTATQPATPGKVQVLEFFNYGCPWCNLAEPTVESWSKAKPANVTFERVPVAFEPSWGILQRAYYVGKETGVEAQVTPLVFKAIHEQGLVVTKPQDLEPIFEKVGMSPASFENAYQSPVINTDVAHAKQLMMQYQVVAIPTFIVDGKYMTNLSIAQGKPDRMMAIVAYLVQLSQQPQPQAAKK